MFERAVESSFAGKDAKRDVDYRKSLIDLCVMLKAKISTNIYNILLQLSEIQAIVYLNEKDRTPTKILRLYNITFIHATAIHESLRNTKSVTKRKLFGQYYHSLVNHAPEVYRLTSLSSINAEDEERAFTFLKSISTATSNHHPDNVIQNAFIRLQVRDVFVSAASSKAKKQKSIVSKNANQIVNAGKTTIALKWIISNPFLYQMHLERIADFLLIEGVWKETANGIEFNDYNEDCLESLKHHFR